MDAIGERNRLLDLLRGCDTLSQLQAVWGSEAGNIRALRRADVAAFHHVTNLKDYRKKELCG